MASVVGSTSSAILRRLASLLTSSITGKAPVPVPIIRRRHCHGIFSSTETGVCPNSSRNFFDGFFLRLRTSPRSITTSCSYVTPSIRIVPKENFWKRILDLHLTYKHFQPAGCRAEIASHQRIILTTRMTQQTFDVLIH